MRNRNSIWSVPAALSSIILTVLLFSLLTVTAGAATEYDLWIDGTRVTSENMSDVLKNGAFSYAPGTKTLTIQKSYEFIPMKTQPAIRCGIPGLVISVKNDCTLSTPKEGYSGADYFGYNMIVLQADTTITGPGRLTIEGAALRPMTTGISVRGCRLTLSDADIFMEEFLPRDRG